MERRIKSRNLAERIAEVIHSKQGKDIVVYDVREMASFTDYIIIATLNSDVQIRAVLKELSRKIKTPGFHVEGEASGGWVLLDYDYVIVNLFFPNERRFYGLERLWGEAELLDINNVRERHRAKT